jgi:hypothetical protein
VTTTKAWSRPLRRARFEIVLPPGARSPSFSYPFRPLEPDGGKVWVYEATQFLPDTDIAVRFEQ